MEAWGEGAVGERRAGGKEAKSFLPLAVALDARGTGCFPDLAGLLGASKGMLGPGEALGRCYGVWVTVGQQGAGGEGRGRLGFRSQLCLSVTLMELLGLYFCL